MPPIGGPRGAILAAAICLCGCAKPLAERPEPPPTGAALVDALRARAAHVTTLRAEAKVDYLAEKGERIKLTMTFLVDRAAGALRVDAESPMGGTVASLASDGHTFELLDTRANRFLEGPATPCNLSRFLRVRLRTRDLVDAIAGGAPLLGQPASVTWDGHDGGHEVLVLKGEGDLVETLRLAPKTWDVDSAEVMSGGHVLYRLRHDDFSDQDGVRFPGRTVIEDPEHRADARIRYKSRELGVTVPPGAFHLEPPPGLPVEHVTCEE